MKNLKLSEEKISVLKFLADRKEWCYPFHMIAEKTDMRVQQVRRICRYLAKHRLAEYKRGLFNEDGEVAGAGYTAGPLAEEYLKEFHN